MVPRPAQEERHERAPPSAQLKADFQKIGADHDRGVAEDRRAGRQGDRRRVPQVGAGPATRDPLHQTAAGRTCAGARPLYDAGLAAAFFMVGVLAMVLASVVGRLAGFNLRGSDAYAGYCMAAAGFLALAHTLKRGEHIRVTLFLERFGPAASPRAGALVARRRHLLLRGAARVLQRAPRRGSPRSFNDISAGQRRHAAVDPADRDGAGRDRAARGDGRRLRAALRGAAARRGDEATNRSAWSSAMDLLITAVLIAFALRAARQRAVDRAGAAGRGVDRHGALHHPRRWATPWRSRCGARCRRGRSPRCRSSCGWARSSSARGSPRTCSRASRRGCSALPGRLLHTNIIGCTIFAAVSGSSAATCATIGKMTLPELKERGYPEGMTIGTLAGAGHARPAHPALDHHDRLRRHGRGLDHAALHRGRAARACCSPALFMGYTSSGRW